MKIKNKFKNIIEIISNVMEAYTTALFIADEKIDFAELYLYQSFCKNIDKDCIIKNGEGLVGWVLRENKSVLAVNYERNTQTLKFYKEDEKIKSLMAIPLPERKGVLYVDSKKSYSFTEEKEKIFKQFAALLFFTITEQKVIDNSRAMENCIESFLNVDKILEDKNFFNKIANNLCNNHGLSYFSIVVPNRYKCTCIYDTKKEEYIFTEFNRAAYSEDGLLGWCIKNKKNLIKNDLKNKERYFVLSADENMEINNFAGIPLYRKGINITGAIGFVKNKVQDDIYFSKRDYWESKEIDILTIVADKIFYNYLKREKLL